MIIGKFDHGNGYAKANINKMTLNVLLGAYLRCKATVPSRRFSASFGHVYQRLLGRHILYLRAERNTSPSIIETPRHNDRATSWSSTYRTYTSWEPNSFIGGTARTTIMGGTPGTSSCLAGSAGFWVAVVGLPEQKARSVAVVFCNRRAVQIRAKKTGWTQGIPLFDLKICSYVHGTLKVSRA